MNLPIIINYFECENCFNNWRIFRNNQNVFRSCCMQCDTWNRRERRVIVNYFTSDIKAYGKFECSNCENEWTSNFTWILYKQKCQYCRKKSYPISIFDKFIEDDYLNERNNNQEGRGHKREYCDKCFEVGDCRRFAIY